MIYKVIKVKQIGDTYKLELTFNDGNVKIFNTEPYIGGDSFIFGPLKNKETFKLFELKDDTVVWETGADFCPNVLYKKSDSL